ncbi:Zinc finger, RING-CH-type [Trichophyton interdigitale]|uniref:E3 ubiquitin-protein ligase listerin n=1 Tax=Trichophyton interdigitale TaxID=101480 RepID=A0A9P4YMJ6_9EURO|nr:Zinc finger, RING-CH-type [Trichophyton interdigitale]KAF3900320.1 Zinc finger, RING-CH-type [Trichophyton interdigitale]KAG8211301.1 Zinc finger, RING-CH-type [Trichophyton interdigitale]
MSGKKFKSQASSSRAAAGGFGGGSFGPFGGFSTAGPAQETPASSLSYVYEPPDLSQISDPQIVVTFKNLLKKDSTTKARALEDLQSHISNVVSSNSSLDDGLLEAWSKVYPRTSIDSSRRVRQLAHSLQGDIVSTAGKRIARYISGAIGAWLAGLYENDKLVKKSAQDSLAKSFPTEEKQQGIWTVYQTSILEFITDAILQQTPLTLSDERTVRPDDANAKHARVVATALQEFTTASTEKLSKDVDLAENILQNRDLWKFSYHEDAFVRRSLYELLQTCLSKNIDCINWKMISTCVLSKSLGISQAGSSSTFSGLLLALTKKSPQLWTTYYSAKSPAKKQLMRYIKAGSEGAGPSYWSELQLMLQSLPLEVLEIDKGDEASIHSIISIVEAIHCSLKKKEETRTNSLAAWTTYIKMSIWMSGKIPVGEKRLRFLEDHLFPILVQFIAADQAQAIWTIDDPNASKVCVELFIALSQMLEHDTTSGLCIKLATMLKDNILISEPEQSQTYRASQDSVCSKGSRFFTLCSGIVTKASESSQHGYVVESIKNSSFSLIETSLQTLQSRNGKPYGAAAVVDEALTKIPSLMGDMEALDPFLANTLPQLILSPSAEHLVSILFACRSRKGFNNALGKAIGVYHNTLISSSQLPSMGNLFSSVTAFDEENNPDFKLLVLGVLQQGVRGDHQSWLDIAAVLQNKKLGPEISNTILDSLIERLSSEDSMMEVLRGLLLLSTESASPIQSYVTSSNGSKLISKLLYLTESSNDEVALLAASLKEQITSIGGDNDSLKPTLEVLERNFKTVDDESLSVESLIAIVQEVLDQSSTDDSPKLLLSLLPRESSWKAALDPYFEVPPKRSCSIMSPLGGAVHIIDAPRNLDILRTLPRDRDGFPIAFRLAYYVTKLLTAVGIDAVPLPPLENVFTYFPLVIQLVDEELSIDESTAILYPLTSDTRTIATEIVSEARILMNGWIQKSCTADTAYRAGARSFISFWERIVYNFEGISPRAYRFAECFARIMAERDAIRPTPSADGKLKAAMETPGLSNPFVLIATIVGYRDSIIETQTVSKLCNQLVADMMGLKDTDNIGDLRKLVILNSLMYGEKNPAKNIPTQRLVFLVKHLITCLQSGEFSVGILSEVLKVLSAVLPLMKEIYGSHWPDLFDELKSLWQKEELSSEYLPVLHSSLRLFSCLRKLATEDSNEDLEDAWKEARKSHTDNMVNMLKQFGPSFHSDQPWDITTDLLSRELSAINADAISDISELFSSLSIESKGVQRATYGIIHRVIPKIQETLSFDVALSKTAVHLPDQLLALLSEVPPIAPFREADIDENFWLGARSYLLGWKVVFDHFASSSIPVQESYSSDIKQKDCLSSLLDFMFDCLETPQGQLIDASKFEIRSFELDTAESSKKEMQWLLVHTYYLALRYLPNTTRAWWVDCKKRLKTPVETWTQRYVSPLIIEDSLQSVSDWYSGQDWDSEDHALEVKVSSKAAEIIGSIEIDEESPPTSIAISLPPTYPLHQATVSGRSRVAVDEKKWKSWLLVIQGVILFSNGNLMDGLMAFRRNVQGALKGQGECPICCSIISANMQTPNKKCGTCKNTFHSDCLFRWFRSSNSSSCPLCRNSFLYS